MTKNQSTEPERLEAQLFRAADKLRKNIDAAEYKHKDILGRVYEYFLGEFALAEGKKGGQFYTPGSISGATQTGTTKTWPASVIQRPRIKKNLSRIKV